MPTWSIYIIDHQSNCILQRYPGIWDNKEEAERFSQELPAPKSARYRYLVLRHENGWKTPENTIVTPAYEPSRNAYSS